METKEYRWIDKSEWERGEWDNEPDKVQWQDLATGLPCLAVRNDQSGNWCGYVGVAEGHPWFEMGYGEDTVDVQVHGGLTFDGHCREHDKEHGICHLPAPGEPDNVWWFGFDCAHAYDLMPGMDALLRKHAKDEPWMGAFHGDTYRTLGYVKNECAQLAQQLAAAK